MGSQSFPCRCKTPKLGRLCEKKSAKNRPLSHPLGALSFWVWGPPFGTPPSGRRTQMGLPLPSGGRVGPKDKNTDFGQSRLGQSRSTSDLCIDEINKYTRERRWTRKKKQGYNNPQETERKQCVSTAVGVLSLGSSSERVRNVVSCVCLFSDHEQIFFCICFQHY